MRILILAFVLAALPSAAAAQEGPRRGAPVPSRAVSEAEAARPTVSKTPDAQPARNRAPGTVPARPPKRPSGS